MADEINASAESKRLLGLIEKVANLHLGPSGYCSLPLSELVEEAKYICNLMSTKNHNDPR